MELAGVFLRMVGPRPWKGPLRPLCAKADLTAPVTVVKAAAHHKTVTSGEVLLPETCGHSPHVTWLRHIPLRDWAV